MNRKHLLDFTVGPLPWVDFNPSPQAGGAVPRNPGNFAVPDGPPSPPPTPAPTAQPRNIGRGAGGRQARDRYGRFKPKYGDNPPPSRRGGRGIIDRINPGQDTPRRPRRGQGGQAEQDRQRAAAEGKLSPAERYAQAGAEADRAISEAQATVRRILGSGPMAQVQQALLGRGPSGGAQGAPFTLSPPRVKVR